MRVMSIPAIKCERSAGSGPAGRHFSGHRALRAGALTLALLGLSAAWLTALDRPKTVERLQNSIEALADIIKIPEEGIPDSLLRNCEALIVIPDTIRGGFFVGGRYGRGIMVRRMPERGWSNPSFVSLKGGSFGLQIGGQAVDIILVVNNKKGLEAVLKDNFTLGADASVAAGPVGRTAEAGTDLTLRAEILSYSRSRGLFAGIAIQGATLTVDQKANYTFYQKLIYHRKILFDFTMPVPNEVKPLHELLRPYQPKP